MMKKSRICFAPSAMLLAATLLIACPALAAPVGSAFTYQGRLDKAGPVNASVNFQFKLFDALSAGAQVGTTQTFNGVAVSAGLFTVTLDFGAGAFNGSARWVEISVQGPGDPSFVLLTPRQAITPAPYAVFALGGSTGFALPYSNGVAAPGQALFTLENTGATGAAAIQGKAVTASDGTGLLGEGKATGLYAQADNVTGLSHGVFGKNFGTDYGSSGVFGQAAGVGGSTTGVWGEATFNPNGTGVYGTGGAQGGYFTASTSGGFGAQGVSTTSTGLRGTSTSGSGVEGNSTSSNGVTGYTSTGHAIDGEANALAAIAVFGTNTLGDGVWGQSNAVGKSGVVGVTYNVAGFGGYFQNNAGGLALFANGLARVKTLQIVGGSDLAEPFDVAAPATGDALPAGMVVSIDPEHPGALRLADTPYDSKVAGVISGANGLSAGLVMKAVGHEHADGGHPVALSGRAWCWVDASFAPVKPGDLLTTSETPGMAMRATESSRAHGAILGKAMTGLERGRGLVLVLVTLE